MTEEGRTVIETATVHPSTLTKLSTGDLDLPAEKTAPRRRLNSAVDHRTMNTELWTTVMDLAEGDRSRIEVYSEVEAMVHNNSNWKKG